LGARHLLTREEILQTRIPESFVAYKRTPEFTEATIPAGLRRNHATKVGVWAKIVVVEGRLRYRIPSLNGDIELSPGRAGIVEPEVPHQVEPIGRVRFFVEFYGVQQVPGTG
jgi:tellurite methyltransferase